MSVIRDCETCVQVGLSAKVALEGNTFRSSVVGIKVQFRIFLYAMVYLNIDISFSLLSLVVSAVAVHPHDVQAMRSQMDGFFSLEQLRLANNTFDRVADELTQQLLTVEQADLENKQSKPRPRVGCNCSSCLSVPGSGDSATQSSVHLPAHWAELSRAEVLALLHVQPHRVGPFAMPVHRIHGCECLSFAVPEASAKCARTLATEATT
jgi:hypothetical protein